MRKLIFAASATALAVVVASCQPEKTVQSVGQVFDPSPVGMVEDTEGQIADTFELKGRDYSAYRAKLPREQTLIMLNEKGQLESDRMQNYVNSVMRKIARAAETRLGVTNFQPLVTVSAQHSVNAFTSPAGAVVVTRGMIQTLENEDQLAFILGHEAAHVLLDHHDNDWVVKSQRHSLTTAEMGMSALAALGEATGNIGLGGELQKYRMIASGALILSRDALMPRFFQKNESEADLLGIDLMVAAGYSPRAANSVGKFLGRMETGADDPASISAEREFADWWDVNKESSGIFSEMFTEIEAEFKKARSESRNKYADAKERQAAIGMYARREYRKIRTNLQTRPYKAALNERRTRTVLQQYDKAANAYKLIGESKLKKARRDAARSARGITASHSYPLIILSEAELADGDERNAIRSLQRAIRGKNPALQTYMTLGQLQADSGKLGSAVKTVAAGRKRFGQAAPIMIQNIALLVRAKCKTQALALSAECKLTFPELEEECQDALKGTFGQKQKAGA